MTRSEKSGTVLSTSSINQDDFLDAVRNQEIARKLHDEYEELDNNYINKITKLLSSYTDQETSDSNFDVCRIALDNLISTEEVYLMETMFENDLDSLSKESVRIIGIDGGLDIRNGNEEKQLSPKQRNFLRQHLTDDDDATGFLGSDIAGQGVKSDDIGQYQGVKGNVSFDAAEVTLEIKNNEEVIGYVNGNHK